MIPLLLALCTYVPVSFATEPTDHSEALAERAIQEKRPDVCEQAKESWAGVEEMTIPTGDNRDACYRIYAVRTRDESICTDKLKGAADCIRAVKKEKTRDATLETCRKRHPDAKSETYVDCIGKESARKQDADFCGTQFPEGNPYWRCVLWGPDPPYISADWFNRKAVFKRDPGICRKLKDIDFHICLVHYAASTGDAAVCDKLSESGKDHEGMARTDRCWMDYAIESADPAKCERVKRYLSDPNWRHYDPYAFCVAQARERAKKR